MPSGSALPPKSQTRLTAGRLRLSVTERVLRASSAGKVRQSPVFVNRKVQNRKVGWAPPTPPLSSWHAGNANPGRMNFVADIEADQQGGDRLDLAGGIQRTDIDGMNS